MMRIAIVAFAGISTFTFTGASRAGFIVTFQQQQNNVVATGSGTINLVALNELGTFTAGNPEVQPLSGFALLGGKFGVPDTIYRGISGPTDFGSGIPSLASSETGNFVGINGSGIPDIELPSGYVSGNSLSNTTTWDNTTIAGLGLTPGTYTWTWGSGPSADFLELVIPSPTATPEPASLTLLGMGAACLVGYRRWRQRKQAVTA